MKIDTHQCCSPPPGCWTRQRWWTRPGPSLSMQWLSDHSDNMMTRQNCKIDGKYVDSENRGLWLRKVHTSLWFTRNAFYTRYKNSAFSNCNWQRSTKSGKNGSHQSCRALTSSLAVPRPPEWLLPNTKRLICHDSRQRNDQDCKIVKLCIRFASLEPWKWQMLSSYC